jgi:hypothetical protein
MQHGKHDVETKSRDDSTLSMPIDCEQRVSAGVGDEMCLA